GRGRGLPGGPSHRGRRTRATPAHVAGERTADQCRERGAHPCARSERARPRCLAHRGPGASGRRRGRGGRAVVHGAVRAGFEIGTWTRPSRRTVPSRSPDPRDACARGGRTHRGSVSRTRCSPVRSFRASATSVPCASRTRSIRTTTWSRRARRGSWRCSGGIRDRDVDEAFPADRPIAVAGPARRLRTWRENAPRISVENEVLTRALVQSERDLGALRIEDPEHPDDDVVAAGAPWFMALFGRDS